MEVTGKLHITRGGRLKFQFATSVVVLQAPVRAFYVDKVLGLPTTRNPSTAAIP